MNIAKLLSVLSLGLLISSAAFAQEEKPKKDVQDMKAMCQQMHTQMTAMDEKMDKLLVDLNAALTPEKKLDAVVAIINEMAAERKAMHAQMDACSKQWDKCPVMMKHHKDAPKSGSQ
jgi:vancomycin resistance protein YoaR